MRPIEARSRTDARSAVLLFAVVMTVAAANAPAAPAQEPAAGVVKILYSPPPDSPGSGAMYPRVIQLRHHETARGHLLATRLPDGRFINVFELIGVQGVPVHVKISDDGVDWGDHDDLGTRIQAEDGTFITGTPYIIWTPFGGPNGTLVASGLGFIRGGGQRVGNGYLINRNLGDGFWTYIEAPIHYMPGTPGGYSQSMVALGEDGREILQLIPVQNGIGRLADILYAKFLLPD